MNTIRRECKSHYMQWLRKAITAYVARRATPPKPSPMTNKGVQPSYDFTFKFVLLGEYQVGKTSLIYRCTDDTFVEAGAFLGCAFKTIAIQVNKYLVQVRFSSSSLGNEFLTSWSLLLWSYKYGILRVSCFRCLPNAFTKAHTGPERFRRVSPIYYRGADGVLLVYERHPHHWVNKFWLPPSMQIWCHK